MSSNDIFCCLSSFWGPNSLCEISDILCSNKGSFIESRECSRISSRVGGCLNAESVFPLRFYSSGCCSDKYSLFYIKGIQKEPSVVYLKSFTSNRKALKS